MADRFTFNLIETGLRAGLHEAREMVGSPDAALAVAERLMREDREAVEDFAGRADLLAGYLRHLGAHGTVNESALAVPEPDTTPLWRAAWDRSTPLRDEFHGDRGAFLAYCRSEHRHGREVPDVAAAEPQVATVTTSATLTPAAAPAVATARVAAPALAAALAQPKPTATSVHLSLGDAGKRLGMPRLDDLPMTKGLLQAMRSAGLRVSRNESGLAWEVNAHDVARLSADRAALERFEVALLNSVSRLCYVGGGHEISIK